MLPGLFLEWWETSQSKWERCNRLRCDDIDYITTFLSNIICEVRSKNQMILNGCACL